MSQTVVTVVQHIALKVCSRVSGTSKIRVPPPIKSPPIKAKGYPSTRKKKTKNKKKIVYLFLIVIQVLNSALSPLQVSIIVNTALLVLHT